MMGRRSFLCALGTGVVLPLITNRDDPNRLEDRRVHLIDVHIAGFRYYEGVKAEVARSLRAGDDVILRREPENAYDEKAVEVYTRSGLKLGYLPRGDNRVIASLADQDIDLRAELCFLDSGAGFREWPGVRVYQLI